MLAKRINKRCRVYRGPGSVCMMLPRLKRGLQYRFMTLFTDILFEISR